jgi:hypothetical protein
MLWVEVSERVGRPAAGRQQADRQIDSHAWVEVSERGVWADLQQGDSRQTDSHAWVEVSERGVWADLQQGDSRQADRQIDSHAWVEVSERVGRPAAGRQQADRQSCFGLRLVSVACGQTCSRETAGRQTDSHALG